MLVWFALALLVILMSQTNLMCFSTTFPYDLNLQQQQQQKLDQPQPPPFSPDHLWLEYMDPHHLAPPLSEDKFLPCLQQHQPDSNRTTTKSLSSKRCQVMAHVPLVAQSQKLDNVLFSLASSSKHQQQQQPPSVHSRRIPSSKSKRTAALCVVSKSEQLYLNEFVDYHLALGFEKIFIFDTSSDFNLQSWANDKRRETQDRIAVTHYHEPAGTSHNNSQLSAYQECWNLVVREGKESKERQPFTWMGIMDVDEFLVLHAPNSHVVDVLERYCSSGALSIHWLVFGHSHQTRYRPYPLSQRFRYRSNTPSPVYRTFAKLSDIASIHDHDIKIRQKGFTSWARQHNLLGKDMQQNETQYDVLGRINSAKIAAIHKFWFKSVEEWFIKACWQGEATDSQTAKSPKNATNAKDVEYLKKEELARLQANCYEKSWAATARPAIATEVYDDSVWRTLKRWVPQYASLES
ncbi:hypothetical protein ACA910_012469 [Epithemia clementina (nom. ined.)]